MPYTLVAPTSRSFAGNSFLMASESDFGNWLRSERKRRGWTMEMLADKADTTQVTISNIERGVRNASRSMVQKLVGALLSDNSDETIQSSLYRDGLRAAGFTADDEIEYVFNPDTIRIAEAYDGAPESIRRAFDALADTVKPARKTTAERVEEVEREGRIGTRPRDE